MLAIEVNFLTGRFVAAAHDDRGLAEWPPHPARLFSALVATWADADHPDPAERNALEWLESQDPPLIAASSAEPRKVVTHFVPVNDASVVSSASYNRRAQKIDALYDEILKVREAGDSAAARRVKSLETRIRRERNITSLVSGVAKKGMDLLPDDRIRQARLYPSVTPSVPRVTFVWQDSPYGHVTEELDRLLGRVTRLGHSSSLVSCRLTTDFPVPSHVPSTRGQVLRSVRKGQLEHLESEYAQHQASHRRRLPYTPVRYATTERDSRQDTWPTRPDTAGDWIVFEFLPGSRRLPSTRAAEVAAALRGAVLAYGEDPVSEGVSGHRPDGAPSSSPHVGFLSLPHVGHEQADGRLMGVAVAVPEALDAFSRRSLLRAIGLWESNEAGPQDQGGSTPVLRLRLGRSGVLKMTRQTRRSGLVALRTRVWNRPARRWVSVTPIALPTHPGPLGKGTVQARSRAWTRAEEAVFASCRHVGLPDPERVVLSFDPFIKGAHPAQHFPPFRQGRSGQRGVARRLVHASVAFGSTISGPLSLGAGRYVGLGLMRPIRAEENGHD